MKYLPFSLRKVKFLKSIVIFSKLVIFFIFFSSYSFASNYPLEIIQPEENIDIKNRFYKAYPGLNYNVRMGVIGGKYPFTYTLVTAPEGMTINVRTGEIDWQMPSLSKTPYNITATVTDAENTIETVSWTVLVTTDGFLFVDAKKGTAATDGGTGAKDNPWKSIKDVYGGDSKADRDRTFHAGEFVYFRSGTYLLDGYINGSNEGGADGTRLTFRYDKKPQVWLAYPGDTMPVIQQDVAHLYFEGPGRDIWLDGFHFRSDGNVRAMGMNISSIKRNVVIRRNKYSGITGGSSVGNNALIFFRYWATGGRFAIQDNEFSDVDVGYGILSYATNRVLVEDNYFHDIGAHAVGMKMQSERWDVRANLFRNNKLDSIWEYYADETKKGAPSGDTEISFNIIESDGGKIAINNKFEHNGLPIHIFRNTIMDGAFQNYVVESNGPFYWKNNVIINNTKYPQKIKKTNIKDSSRLIIENNLTGTLSDGIVGSQGNLTEEYSEFIGTHGHQSGNPPASVFLKIDN